MGIVQITNIGSLYRLYLRMHAEAQITKKAIFAVLPRKNVTAPLKCSSFPSAMPIAWGRYENSALLVRGASMAMLPPLAANAFNSPIVFVKYSAVCSV